MPDRAEWVWTRAIERGLSSWVELGDLHARHGKFLAAFECFQKQLAILSARRAERSSTTALPAATVSSSATTAEKRTADPLLLLEIAEVHKRIGSVHVQVAQTAQQSSVQVSTTSPAAFSPDLAQAHSHFEAAMLLGLYDTDVRRFFAAHPLPTAGPVVNPVSASIGSIRETAPITLPAAAASKLHSRHRWVVRHLVEEVSPEVLSRGLENSQDAVFDSLSAADEETSVSGLASAGEDVSVSEMARSVRLQVAEERSLDSEAEDDSAETTEGEEESTEGLSDFELQQRAWEKQQSAQQREQADEPRKL